jgi:HAD superfamily hydrolase (TIGR01549 family)
MTIHTFLFDFDGTLADTAPAIIATVNQTLNSCGYNSASENEIKNLIGKPLEIIFEKLEPNCDSKLLALNYKSSYLEIARSKVELFKGTQEFLEKLKIEGKELAIISTKSTKAIEQHLKDFGMSDLFSLVIGGDSVTNQKPDPEGILLAIKSLQANPKTTIMIGDTKDDLLAAKNAEIKSALVEWTNQSIESLKSEFKPILIGSWRV